MIEVSFQRGQIKIAGHSGYATSSSDIVCSAVSTLFQTMLKFLLELTDDRISYHIKEESAMDITFLTNYINPLILGICLLVGYVIKTAIPQIPNRFIPLSVLVLGTVIAVGMNYPDVSAELILGGMMSGLSSTGLYELLRNLLNKGVESTPEE